VFAERNKAAIEREEWRTDIRCHLDQLRTNGTIDPLVAAAEVPTGVDDDFFQRMPNKKLLEMENDILKQLQDKPHS
jgi:hypothetical protein